MAPIEMVSLNTKGLRGGKLVDDISGVFGSRAFLTLDKNSDKTVASALRDALGSNLSRVIDLFHEWDTSPDGQLSRAEFVSGVQRLGLQAP